MYSPPHVKHKPICSMRVVFVHLCDKKKSGKTQNNASVQSQKTQFQFSAGGIQSGSRVCHGSDAMTWDFCRRSLHEARRKEGWSCVCAALVGEDGEGDLAGSGGVDELCGHVGRCGEFLGLDVERVDLGAPRRGCVECRGRDADREGRADKDDGLGAVEPVADGLVLEERVRRVVLVKEERERHDERAARGAPRRDHVAVLVLLELHVLQVLCPCVHACSVVVVVVVRERSVRVKVEKGNEKLRMGRWGVTNDLEQR